MADSAACVCGETSSRNCPVHAPLDAPAAGEDDHVSAFDGAFADGLDGEPAAFRCVPDESGGLDDEHRHFATGKPIHVQTPACDRCSVGVMDADNPHLYGECDCACHAENAAYGPGNPDWEYDRAREDARA